MMKLLQSIALLPTLLIRGTEAHSLGSVFVNVQSNETLHMITEFNFTNHTQYHGPQVFPVQELNEASLAMEIDICFPNYYCPKVIEYLYEFETTFLTEICKVYCVEPVYDHALEILSVCEEGSGSNTYNGDGCVDFGLTIHAHDRAKAEEIKLELGALVVDSKPAFWELLHTLAPEFKDNESDLDPNVAGDSVNEDAGETWYPAWNDGNEDCSNDGNPPFYMQLEPENYIFQTRTDCCRKHFWWSVRGCAEPEKRPCPEGYVPDAEQTEREGIMSGKYYGSYPNIFYPGCIPINSLPETSPSHSHRALKRETAKVLLKEEERQRELLRQKEQEQKLEALLERQQRLEKFMLPSSRMPPVQVADWKPQRLR